MTSIPLYDDGRGSFSLFHFGLHPFTEISEAGVDLPTDLTASLSGVRQVFIFHKYMNQSEATISRPTRCVYRVDINEWGSCAIFINAPIWYRLPDFQ